MACFRAWSLKSPLHFSTSLDLWPVLFENITAHLSTTLAVFLTLGSNSYMLFKINKNNFVKTTCCQGKIPLFAHTLNSNLISYKTAIACSQSLYNVSFHLFPALVYNAALFPFLSYVWGISGQRFELRRQDSHRAIRIEKGVIKIFPWSLEGGRFSFIEQLTSLTNP